MSQASLVIQEDTGIGVVPPVKPEEVVGKQCTAIFRNSLMDGKYISKLQMLYKPYMNSRKKLQEPVSNPIVSSSMDFACSGRHFLLSDPKS